VIAAAVVAQLLAATAPAPSDAKEGRPTEALAR
jgi:hypothetical protein